MLLDVTIMAFFQDNISHSPLQLPVNTVTFYVKTQSTTHNCLQTQICGCIDYSCPHGFRQGTHLLQLLSGGGERYIVPYGELSGYFCQGSFHSHILQMHALQNMYISFQNTGTEILANNENIY